MWFDSSTFALFANKKWHYENEKDEVRVVHVIFFVSIRPEFIL